MFIFSSRDHVSAARTCLQKFLEVSQRCLRKEDRPGLNVTLQMVDSAIAFTCHNSGDRIALFMSEQGVECVTTHKEEILACINQSVPEVFNTYNNLHNYKMHFYVFQQENCRYSFIPLHSPLYQGCAGRPYFLWGGVGAPPWGKGKNPRSGAGQR